MLVYFRLLEPSLDEYRESFANHFPDEDICLYKEFPFNQLVILIDELLFLKNTDNLTCTYLWIARFFSIYATFNDAEDAITYLKTLNMSTITESIVDCDFERRLEKCSKSNYYFDDLNRLQLEINSKMALSYSHMIFIFMSQVVCLIGLISNTLVIITVSHKKNRKELEDKRHYDYMRLNSIVNCCISILHIIGLLNECTKEFWCSAVSNLVPIQYLKIVFSSFLDTLFRFMANFIYVAFCLCRISLIGKDHTRIVSIVSEKMKIKTYMGISLFLSALFSVVKCFDYKINEFMDYSLDYPEKILWFSSGRSPGDSIHNFSGYLYFVSSIICDLLKYPVFITIVLILDLKTAKRLEKTILEKAITGTPEIQEKKRKENENAIVRSKKMVKVNAILNFMLKLPVASNSIIQMIYNFLYFNIKLKFEYYNDRKEKNLFVYVCYELYGCQVFEYVSNFLFLVSLCACVFYFYKFDRLFMESYQRVFFRKKSLKSFQMFAQRPRLSKMYPKYSNDGYDLFLLIIYQKRREFLSERK